MSILSNGYKIGEYSVQKPILDNQYCENYRVTDENENPFFLKLYIMKRCPSKLIGIDGIINEISHSRHFNHKNIVSYIDSGSLELPEGGCQYLITNYLSGEMLINKIYREGKLSLEESLNIFYGILDGLDYMHKMTPALVHNDITPRNIMLSEATAGTPEIIDMAHVSGRCVGSAPFEKSDLDILYSANETFAGMYDEQSDIFAATAVLYCMLSGHAPWEMTFEEGDDRQKRIEAIKQKRKESLEFDDLDINESIRDAITKGLSIKYNDRYDSIAELRQALLRGSRTTDDSDESASVRTQSPQMENKAEAVDKINVTKGQGRGFEDIAGMQELKDMLRQKVIFVMQNKELAEQYKITPPNGMLLYGPPGCGKTFFAEKFAEETKFNFMLIKSSDIASIYVHGSQEKIAELFKTAEKNAPTVICFDEFDAFVPTRSGDTNQHYAMEVNEFLSQLNNCSKRGIFVVATSNRPDKIDPAVLRTGRIDQQIYVPLPDYQARHDMFALYLKERPCEEINLHNLAQSSEGYVASDIAYVVNDVALAAAFTRSLITQEMLETTINVIKPSVKQDVIKFYDNLREKMEGVNRDNSRPRIGFI